MEDRERAQDLGRSHHYDRGSGCFSPRTTQDMPATWELFGDALIGPGKPRNQ